jgi:hypothetical protein
VEPNSIATASTSENSSSLLQVVRSPNDLDQSALVLSDIVFDECTEQLEALELAYKHKREEQAHVAAELQESLLQWDKANPAPHPSPFVDGNGVALGLHYQPSPLGAQMRVLDFKPELHKVVDRLLVRTRQTQPQREAITICRDAFMAKTRIIRGANLEKLGPAPAAKNSDCYLATFCVCKMPGLRSIVDSFRNEMRIVLRKGGPARIAYDQAMLVIGIHQHLGVQAPHAATATATATTATATTAIATATAASGSASISWRTLFPHGIWQSELVYFCCFPLDTCGRRPRASRSSQRTGSGGAARHD